MLHHGGNGGCWRRRRRGGREGGQQFLQFIIYFVDHNVTWKRDSLMAVYALRAAVITINNTYNNNNNIETV